MDGALARGWLDAVLACSDMEGINFNEELGRATVAAFVAFAVGLILRARAAGEWLLAATDGTIGGLAAETMHGDVEDRR